MPKIQISLDAEEKSILEKRAKKNLMTLQEQVEDIVRRSCVNYKKGATSSKIDADDRLVHIFSREARGRKRKK